MYTLVPDLNRQMGFGPVGMSLDKNSSWISHMRQAGQEKPRMGARRSPSPAREDQNPRACPSRLDVGTILAGWLAESCILESRIMAPARLNHWQQACGTIMFALAAWLGDDCVGDRKVSNPRLGMPARIGSDADLIRPIPPTPFRTLPFQTGRANVPHGVGRNCTFGRTFDAA